MTRTERPAVPLTGGDQIHAPAPGTEWWRDAVIYQVYPRSFADGNGDGMGDLPGITSRLDHLAKLGVDAVWLSPFYRSPQKDAGYDVTDYRQVDPRFGTLDDFDAMRARAHELGLRVIVDLVPNHSSDQHVWFQEALAAAPGSLARDRYMFRDGKGADGAEPPNNWQSIFGGPAWTRLAPREDDGPAGPQWYLHLFDSSQPDLNWDNAEVRAEFEDVLRFWLDRGVDGFRVDVAHGMIKETGLPDWDGKVAMVEGSDGANGGSNEGPMFDQDGVHEIYRAWHKVLDEYDGDRCLVAEAWVSPMSRLARYVREDEMQQAFNFAFLVTKWNAGKLRDVVTESLETMDAVGAPTTWVLSNHDVVRHASRLGLDETADGPMNGIGPADVQPDAELGLRRARAATLLMLSLPGSAYLYQGEELGLPDHTTLPDDVRQDPAFFRTHGAEVGRDGCRIPLPWEADRPGLGFGPSDATWLPQPESYRALAADQQYGVDGSTFELYRGALGLRRAERLGQGGLTWVAGYADAADVVALRVADVIVLSNLGAAPVVLPEGAEVLIASGPLTESAEGIALPTDTTVWIRG
ncbi:glycoside hydrolase family 13 protein [Myceligenerans indicum]|uniref:Glycoside hydrolase family 13 protein n=1 Tax=Myceligenerans indicum TaxID=2593663 RepID=A0ABS1LQ81_9MICO|nr:glycoside hydrolase family 13 protein [Myceligenerans indicum]MBL0888446.1 glycoside hydrolase family 13 protein [Myceligenerans indicum]